MSHILPRSLRAAVLMGLLTSACEGGEGDEGGSNAIPVGPCTTATYWRGGTQESPLMQPGAPCIKCHTERNEGPRFTIAGTIFQSLHDVTNCNGVNGHATDIKVVVTGADGAVTTMAVNQAGNFYFQGTVKTPFHAKVIANGEEFPMAKEQTSGDCNTCHSSEGTMDAPGRILIP